MLPFRDKSKTTTAWLSSLFELVLVSFVAVTIMPHLKIGKRYQSQRTLKILIPRTQDPSWTSSNQKVKQSKLFSCVAVPTKNHNGNQVLLHFATRFEPIIHCRTNTIKTSKSNRLAVESSGSLMAF